METPWFRPDWEVKFLQTTYYEIDENEIIDWSSFVKITPHHFWMSGNFG